MFTQTVSHNRFNLLLLSEGEHYFNDYAAVFYPSYASDSESIAKQLKGRIKVCSKSLFFDPEDSSYPIVKYPYHKITEIEALKSGSIHQINNGEAFYLRSSLMVQMKENNMIRPYTFLNGDVLHRFSIKYAPVKSLLDEVKRLYQISKLHYYDANEKINKIVEERESKVAFDMTWMASLDERTILETLAIKITPLVNNAGRLVITNKMLYFQPFNNVAANPVEKMNLTHCRKIIKRRHELRPLAVELFFEEHNSSNHFYSSNASLSKSNNKSPNSISSTNGHSIFFAFKDTITRDSVCDKLMNMHGVISLDHENQSQTTWKWQCGLISNFDYLMYLNSLAHRSFNDLTQYPVFPWILSDYSSTHLDLDNPKSYRDLCKPIGALNPDRLGAFKKRYMETPSDQDRFLYGTHYSTPAYVLYYLVRIAPEYMLKLQNGRFDEAERLFNSIEDSWENVLTNTADLKELIPEFFSTELPGRSSGEFLCNHEDINFGRRADGTQVGDVQLPKWASSASDFISMNRKALESEFVSMNLNNWIDLIFGYKQRGEMAIKSDNLFHPLTYEGEVDIDSVKDPDRRSAILMQINEFGQTPAQIFDKPHPVRFSASERKMMMEAASGPSSNQPSNNFSNSGSSNNHSTSNSSSFRPSNSSPLRYGRDVNSSNQATTLSSMASALIPSTTSSPSQFISTNNATNLTHSSGRTFGGASSSLLSSREKDWSVNSNNNNNNHNNNHSSIYNNHGSNLSSYGHSYSQPIASSRGPIEVRDLGIGQAMSPDPHLDQIIGALGQLSPSPAAFAPIHDTSSLSDLLSHQSSTSSTSNTHSSSQAINEYLSSGSNILSDSWSKLSKLVPADTWKFHRQGVTCLCLSLDAQTLYSVSQDSSLKIFSLAENKQLRSTNISKLALSSCALSMDQKFVAIGSWDNNIYVYSNDYGRVMTTIQAHDDTVSCLAMRENILLSGSWDTSMKAWHILPTGIQSVPMMDLSCLDSTVRTVHLSADMNLALCGSDDGMLAIADIRTDSVVRTWTAHDDAITAAQFTNDGRIISCSAAGTMKVQEASGNNIFAIEIPESFHCMATNGASLLTGDSSSTLRIWDLLHGEEKVRMKRNPPSPITCLVPSENCDFVITGSDDGSLTKWIKS